MQHCRYRRRTSRDRRNVRQWISSVLLITGYAAAMALYVTAENFPAAASDTLGEGHDDETSATNRVDETNDVENASTAGASNDETKESETDGAASDQSGNNRTSRSSSSEKNEQTLLDQFGDVAKEYLTQHLIPETDEACRWDWRYARCEPNCECLFQPVWGDFHLGRSCRRRLLPAPKHDNVCHLPPKTPYVLVYRGLATGVKVVNTQTTRGFTAASNQFTKARTSICEDLRKHEATGQEVSPMRSTFTRVACPPSQASAANATDSTMSAATSEMEGTSQRAKSYNEELDQSSIV